MTYSEIHADAAGVSHFRDVEVSFAPGVFDDAERPLRRSGFKGGRAGFVSVPAGWDSGWHNSPGDGFAVLLKGEVEIEAGSGEVRRFLPGDVWRSTDMTGRGHISRAVSSEDALVLMVDFDESAFQR